jgi:hypothetical protein
VWVVLGVRAVDFQRLMGSVLFAKVPDSLELCFCNLRELSVMDGSFECRWTGW